MAVPTRQVKTGKAAQAHKVTTGTPSAHKIAGQYDEEDDQEADIFGFDPQDEAPGSLSDENVEGPSGLRRESIAQSGREPGRTRTAMAQRASRPRHLKKQGAETGDTGHVGYPLHFGDLGASDFLSSAQLDELIDENGLYAPKKRRATKLDSKRGTLDGHPDAVAAVPSTRRSAAPQSKKSLAPRSRAGVRLRLRTTLWRVAKKQ